MQLINARPDPTYQCFYVYSTRRLPFKVVRQFNYQLSLKENIVIKDKIKISAGSVVLKSFNNKDILIYGSPAEARR